MSAFIKLKESEINENNNASPMYSPVPAHAATMASSSKKHNFDKSERPGKARKNLREEFRYEEEVITNIVPSKNNAMEAIDFYEEENHARSQITEERHA